MKKYLEVIQTSGEEINPFVTKIFSEAFEQATRGSRILIIQFLKKALVNSQNDFSKISLCSDNLVWIRGEYGDDSPLVYQGDFQGFDKVILESPLITFDKYDGHQLIINPGYEVNLDLVDSYTILRRFE